MEYAVKHRPVQPDHPYTLPGPISDYKDLVIVYELRLVSDQYDRWLKAVLTENIDVISDNIILDGRFLAIKTNVKGGVGIFGSQYIYRILKDAYNYSEPIDLQ